MLHIAFGVNPLTIQGEFAESKNFTKKKLIKNPQIISESGMHRDGRTSKAYGPGLNGIIVTIKGMLF